MSLNKDIGATFIVAGTTIGAGMLALPLISYSLNIISLSSLLIVSWLFMLYVALILIESNVALNTLYGVSELAKKILGPLAKFGCYISIITLFYALLTAYISGLTSVIQENVIKLHYPNTNLISTYIIPAAIALIFSVMIFISNKVVDYSNRVLFTFKITFFVLILTIICPYFKIENINALSNNSLFNTPILYAIPILCTSFGFHGSIMYITKYVYNKNTSKELLLRRVASIFTIGSIIPIIIYSIWLFLIIGTIPLNGSVDSFTYIKSHGDDLSVFLNVLSNVSHGGASLKEISSTFIWFAIITSLLGVSIGLYDFFIELFKYNIASKLDKIKALIFTFAVPVIFVMIQSKLFVKALAFASISLSVLAIIIPCLIAWKIINNKVKYIENNENYDKNKVDIGNNGGSYKFVFIKKPLIGLTLIYGFGVIFIEIFNLISIK